MYERAIDTEIYAFIGNENSRRTRQIFAHTAVDNRLRVLTCTNIEPQYSRNHPVKSRCFSAAAAAAAAILIWLLITEKEQYGVRQHAQRVNFFLGKISNNFHTRSVCG